MSEILGSISWGGFAAVLVAAYLVPGPDLLIILRCSVRDRRAGLAAAVGAQSGLGVHMLLAAVGLSVLLVRYPVALSVLQVAGALYLTYLGVALLRSAPRQEQSEDQPRNAFTQGLLTNLLNPKAILFFVSVLPQFVAPGHSVWPQVLTLGIVDIAFGFLPWALVIVLGVRLSGWLRSDRHQRLWNRISGGLLIGVGLFLGVLAWWQRG